MTVHTEFDKIYEGCIEPGREPKKLFRSMYNGAVRLFASTARSIRSAIPIPPTAYPSYAA